MAQSPKSGLYGPPSKSRLGFVQSTFKPHSREFLNCPSTSGGGGQLQPRQVKRFFFAPLRACKASWLSFFEHRFEL